MGWPRRFTSACRSASESRVPRSRSRSSISLRTSSRSSATTSCRCSAGSQELTAARYRSTTSTAVLLQDALQGGVDALPLQQELLQDLLPVGGEPVEALVALVLLPPLAGQKALALQPAQQRVERALVDVHPL